MPWQQQAVGFLTDLLKVAFRVAMMINALIIAIASIYLTARFTFRLAQWIDATFLDHPWK